jgi:patatin-like phospholipase/acyl hydrolase
MFGDTLINEALASEIMIVSYEFNKKQPRIFSKFTSEANPSVFNVTISDAAQASAAAPTYFNPKVIGDEVLIDGGLIANNPALIAYLRSRKLYNQTSIRVLSIGTGETKGKKIDPSNISIFTWLEAIPSLLTEAE